MKDAIMKFVFGIMVNIWLVLARLLVPALLMHFVMNVELYGLNWAYALLVGILVWSMILVWIESKFGKQCWLNEECLMQKISQWSKR